jgi:ribonuclease D
MSKSTLRDGPDTASVLETVVHSDDLPEDVMNAGLEGKQVAWDTETSGLNPVTDALYVCQVLIPTHGIHLVQLGEYRPANLMTLLSSEAVTKVFHHALFDLRFMLHHWGTSPRNVACTKITSKILHPDAERHGLKDLLADHLDVHISKDQRLTDWSQRPLTDEQVQYAAGDVAHLLPLLETLQDIAAADGLAGDVESSFDYIPTRTRLDLRGSGDVFTY